MKLRARLAIAVFGAAVPAVAATAFIARATGRRAMVSSVYEATRESFEDGGRERCEDRARFRETFGMRPPPRARRGRRRRQGEHGRLHGRRPQVYSDRFEPVHPRVPPIPDSIRRQLESGDEVSALWEDRDVTIGMRMPWTGPCSVIVVRRPTGPFASSRAPLSLALWSIVVAVVASLGAFFALGPVVRRVRGLTAQVRAQKGSGYRDDVQVEGGDEVGELARAYNDMRAELVRSLSELEARDEALSTFLANTTHDVMVPLTVLSGHVSTIAAAADRGESAPPEAVTGAIRETQYVVSLIQNLKAAVRLSAGEPMLKRHRFDLRDYVERAVTRHRPLARQRQIEIEFAVPERVVWVDADSTLLEQAIGNLVHNAVRYNRDGGHVAVVLSLNELRFSLQVIDDGPGIDPEELPRVVARRFRGSEARQRDPDGLGLGLPIVHEVAQKHGWRFELTSPTGGGVCAELSGPCEEPEP